ncbi:hypothetical protein niasHT_020161 [Heterodera trifolii]|uniref:Uncharacterized protein n=1 Tax=Heterodera trifolii TaxID=157864 RepID=A0ABD2KHY9_9BILA
MKWAANVRERAENLSKFSSIGPLFTPLSGIKQHSASELRGQLPRGTDANAQQRELHDSQQSFELFETASERKESAEKEQTKQCKEFAAAGLTRGETSETASERKESTEKGRKKPNKKVVAAGLTPTDELDITASTSTPSFLRNLSFVYRMPKLFRTNTYSFKK